MWSLLIASSLNAATPVKPAPEVWRPPPTPNVNCLTPLELLNLQMLQARLEERKREAPECETSRGGPTCLTEADATALALLLARQAGDADACGTE